MVQEAKSSMQSCVDAKVWSGFHEEMIGLSRWVLRNVRRSIGDHEDAVNSAFRTYFRREREQGRMPEEQDPDDVWPALTYHLVRKMDKYRHQTRYKKNQGIRMGDLMTDEQVTAWKEAFVDKEVSLEEVEQFVNAALSILDEILTGADDELRTVAALKLQAYTNKEISNQMPGLSESAVGRKLARIRNILRKTCSGDVNTRE